MNDKETQGQFHKFKIAQGVYLGALMAPSDVAKATRGREGELYQTPQLHRWTLCGEVSPALFELLQATQMLRGAHERLTAFGSPRGYHYAVFTHQMGGFQHRFFVPMYENRVIEFLDAIAQDGCLGYSLAGEGDQAIVWRSVLGARDFKPLLAMRGKVPEGEEGQALEEFASLVHEARDPGRIASTLKGVEVRYASVSAIGPNELVRRLALRYGVKA